MLFAWSVRAIVTRDSLDSPWKKPTALPKFFHEDEAFDDDIELSADGREVYLSLEGDIHVIRRVPKRDSDSAFLPSTDTPSSEQGEANSESAVFPEQLDDLATGTWVPLFTSAAELELEGATDDKATWTDGVVEIETGTVKALAAPVGRNVILQAEVNRLAGRHANLTLGGPEGSDSVIVCKSSVAYEFQRYDAEAADRLRMNVRIPRPRAELTGFQDVAIAVVNGCAAVYLDGQRVAEQDGWNSSVERSPRIRAVLGNPARAQFRNVRVMVLDDESSDDQATLTPTEILTSPDWEWTDPEPIAEVNSEANDLGPTISADRLTMVFASTREGGHGITDLWISERASVTESWGSPHNMGPQVNTRRVEREPELSADGLTLLISRLTPASADLFVTTRNSRNDPWSAAVDLGKPVNTALHEQYPSLCEDGLALMYSLRWPVGHPDGRKAELRISRRDALDSPWSEPEDLGPLINTKGAQKGACLSSDGLVLLFSQHRRGTATDRFMATRDSKTAPWNKPVPLANVFQTMGEDSDIELSSDGREVYLELNGDIHVIRRVPK